MFDLPDPPPPPPVNPIPEWIFVAVVCGTYLPHSSTPVTIGSFYAITSSKTTASGTGRELSGQFLAAARASGLAVQLPPFSPSRASTQVQSITLGFGVKSVKFPIRSAWLPLSVTGSFTTVANGTCFVGPPLGMWHPIEIESPYKICFVRESPPPSDSVQLSLLTSESAFAQASKSVYAVVAVSGPPGRAINASYQAAIMMSLGRMGIAGLPGQSYAIGNRSIGACRASIFPDELAFPHVFDPSGNPFAITQGSTGALPWAELSQMHLTSDGMWFYTDVFEFTVKQLVSQGSA